MRRTLIAFSLGIGMAVSPAFADATGDVQGVISSQIDSFRAKDHGQAFSHAAPGIRLMFRNEANFARMVEQGYKPIYGAQSYRFGRTRMEGADTIYQEVMLTGPNGKSWVALYTMALGNDGVWKIAGVRLVPGTERTT